MKYSGRFLYTEIRNLIFTVYKTAKDYYIWSRKLNMMTEENNSKSFHLQKG